MTEGLAHQEKSISQRERVAEGRVRGTTSNNFYLWYPSPNPLRSGEGFLDPCPVPLSRRIMLRMNSVLLLMLTIGQASYVSTTSGNGSFPLVQGQQTAAIYVDNADWPGVVRAVGDLQSDIERVTNRKPVVTSDTKVLSRNMVIIGTIGKSPLIDQLARSKKIDTSSIVGKWESFFLQTVSDPMPGVASALVIAGSDKRGTIFGIYDLSEQIGVSPWYYWADVTPEHKDALFIKSGKYQQGEPSVKYRGIFFNDEKPDLDYWVRAKFGEHPTPGGGTGTVANFNSKFYGKVFELILRLKGNYLWPAMWNNAFAEDDVENPRLADEYGIVMGTSHQEPMLRAQKEWDWHLRQQNGNWNFATQEATMTKFWREGVEQRKNFENIYTIGLRGENDSAMVQGVDESISLLQHIVEVQRKIIKEVVTPKVEQVPQVWALYKEVQGFYERGLRVPDDVTLLWAEDNWGDVRRVPTAEERKRSGGAGIYYHFDYHGGPRSYQWVNTSPIAKIWDQMSLAKQYGADRVWIVNVGHFKGYELPTEYFLDLAWNTERWTNDNINEYTRLWAGREFGTAFAGDIADILAKYTKFNGRRKPELVDAGTYSLVNFQEAETFVSDFNAIAQKAQGIYEKLPASKKDAFYELVLYPTKASANLNEMYLAAAKNALYTSQGRASANDHANRTRELYQADADLMSYYNKTLGGGKWDHFMDQSHIGYTSWQDPPANTMNAIRLTSVTPAAGAALGVAVEGLTSAWPGSAGDPALPRFDALNQQRYFIDVFNKGKTPFDFIATASAPWIVLSESKGNVAMDRRLWVNIDWNRAPKGSSGGTVHIQGAAADVLVRVDALNPSDVTRASLQGFAEGAGYVSIEPEHYTRKTDAGTNRWVKVEDYGRTLSGMRANAVVDAPAAIPGKDSPSLEYRIYVLDPGAVTANLILSPTLNYQPGRGLHLAVSFDDQAPQIITAVPENFSAQNGNADWEKTVRDNARTVSASATLASAGYHTMKVWMVDPAMIVQKIVVNMGTGKPATSYLGPPESYRSR